MFVIMSNSLTQNPSLVLALRLIARLTETGFMDRRDQYRERAARCLRLAQSTTPSDKLALLELAQAWQRMADRADSDTRPHEAQEPEDSKSLN